MSAINDASYVTLHSLECYWWVSQFSLLRLRPFRPNTFKNHNPRVIFCPLDRRSENMSKNTIKIFYEDLREFMAMVIAHFFGIISHLRWKVMHRLLWTFFLSSAAEYFTVYWFCPPVECSCVWKDEMRGKSSKNKIFAFVSVFIPLYASKAKDTKNSSKSKEENK